MSLDAYFLRAPCYALLTRWEGSYSIYRLAEILSVEDIEQFRGCPTEDQKRLMKLLSGPNGYTIYKMLLANNKTSNIPVKK